MGSSWRGAGSEVRRITGGHIISAPVGTWVSFGVTRGALEVLERRSDRSDVSRSRGTHCRAEGGSGEGEGGCGDNKGEICGRQPGRGQGGWALLRRRKEATRWTDLGCAVKGDGACHFLFGGALGKEGGRQPGRRRGCYIQGRRCGSRRQARQHPAALTALRSGRGTPGGHLMRRGQTWDRVLLSPLKTQTLRCQGQPTGGGPVLSSQPLPEGHAGEKAGDPGSLH